MCLGNVWTNWNLRILGISWLEMKCEMRRILISCYEILWYLGGWLDVWIMLMFRYLGLWFLDKGYLLLRKFICNSTIYSFIWAHHFEHQDEVLDRYFLEFHCIVLRSSQCHQIPGVYCALNDFISWIHTITVNAML